MQHSKRTKKRSQVILRVFCIVIIAFAVAAAGLVYLFTQVPRTYHPLAPVAREQVNSYLTHYLAPTFHNNVQLDRPFQVIVLQQQLNEIIVDEHALGRSWPVYLNGVTISAPSVVFMPSTIYLMATVDYAGFPVVVSIIASPQLNEQGLLSLNVRKVKAGALTVTPLARYIAGRVIAAQMPQIERNQWLKDLEAAIMQNAPFDPVFPVYQSEKSIRLTSAEIEASRLVLGFAPAG